MLDQFGFARPEPALPGVVGPRTSYSKGKATAEQWVEKARASGLAWIVFLEDFASLPNEDFQKLKADCARLSSPQFEAVPGFTIDDEVGNQYFYFGTSFPYPEAKFLTPDGKRLRSRDAQLNARQPCIPGQLAMTTLDYAYSISSFKLISSLPVAISGLNNRWSAFLYDRQLKKSRPVGVLEGKAWAAVNLAGQAELFVGHPVRVDHPELFVQLTQSGEEKWTLEIHNPTGAPITTRIRVHPGFDPLKGKALPAGPIAIPSGESWIGNY